MPLAVLRRSSPRKCSAAVRTRWACSTSALGLGSLVGALVLAARKTVLGLGRQIAWASGAFGLSLIVFSFSAVLWLSMPLLVLTGFTLMMETAASNTVLQTIVEDDKRGRVMSFYTMAFLGVAPLGSLLGGALAGRWGVPQSPSLPGPCGLASLVFTLRLPALRALVRPIYRRIGVLPDVTSGIASVAPLSASQEESLNAMPCKPRRATACRR